MSEKPLAGVLVVDLTRLLPGPLAARLLADLGARVIKVEEPELGDPVRRAPPFAGGESALARMLLGGLESVALDLRREEARRILSALLERADILLESFRPGTLAAWDLDPKDLRERFPRLVIGSLSGWGQGGPHAGRSGHDLTYQAVAGTLAGGRGMPNLPAADLLAAWSLVGSVLAALIERQRGGEGCWIDAALLDAAAHGGITSRAAEAGGSKGVGEPLALTGALPCYNLYRTRDGGQIALAALEPHFWKRFCAALGRRDLVRLQFKGDPESRRRIAALAGERTRAEWERFFAAHDLPGEPVLSIAESQRHPQVVARGLAGEDPEGAEPVPFPALFDGRRPEAAGGLPALGGDTGRVLEELGLEEAELPARLLRRRGIGRRPSLRRALERAVRRLA